MSRPSRQYLARHERVREARGKASTHNCVGCGQQAQEWARKHNADPDVIMGYQPMCCSCHQKYDDHWSEEARKKVADSVRKVWASNPARREFTEEHRANMRAAWVRRKARMQGGDA